jgi:hypothetical protein
LKKKKTIVPNLSLKSLADFIIWGVVRPVARHVCVGNVVGGAAQNSGEGLHSGGGAAKEQEYECMRYIFQLLCYHASVCKG